ncbi:GNAT family N-acetyltransferase [Halorussus marinus]|uniref:GNAT family N-acetyltransferase n=1 Tax=Halorussus marinus TaxID=2505976 RepID=UPI0010924CC3|nr:GNAT family N-acetyltransferase [Halorussus marinus]
MRLRFATPDDAAAVRAIYAPVVRETAISFAETPPSVADLRAQIADGQYPWLVCEAEEGDAEPNAVVGFAKAGPHKDRAAYRWAVDVSAYVREGWRGRGVGTGLYEALLETLAAQRFHLAVAVIALPNPASVGLHESKGFERVGTFEAVGYKRGEWRDVGWWQLSLADRPADPDEPRPVSAVCDVDRVGAALDRGAASVDR